MASTSASSSRTILRLAANAVSTPASAAAATASRRPVKFALAFPARSQHSAAATVSTATTSTTSQADVSIVPPTSHATPNPNSSSAAVDEEDPEVIEAARQRRQRRMRKTMVSQLEGLASGQSRMPSSPSDPDSFRAFQPRLDPLTARQTTISHLLAATAHVGHDVSALNRAATGYVYGLRHGVAIIDVERHTLPALRRAASVVKEVVLRDGVVLFLGTAPGTQRAIVAAAQRLGPNGFHVTMERWMPGVLSNAPKLLGKAIMGDMDHYAEVLREQRQGGSTRRNAQDGAEEPLGNRRGRNDPPMPDAAKLASQLLQPDLMVVLNPKQNLHAIREATERGIATVGITDTDVDPRVVTYAIPANDESVRTAELVVGALSLAGAEGRRERRRLVDEREKAASRAAQRTQRYGRGGGSGGGGETTAGEGDSNTA